MQPVGVVAAFYGAAEFLKCAANPIVSDAHNPEIIARHTAKIPRARRALIEALYCASSALRVLMMWA